MESQSQTQRSKHTSHADMIFFLFKMCMYLFMALLALHCCTQAFFCCSKWGLLCSCTWASHCGAFSCYSLWALEFVGSVVALHGLSFSTLCGIFLDQGSNLYPLFWQVDSKPPDPQGSAYIVMIDSLYSGSQSPVLLEVDGTMWLKACTLNLFVRLSSVTQGPQENKDIPIRHDIPRLPLRSWG